jgi:N-acetylglucosamine kinase-like BadF-type ATPase
VSDGVFLGIDGGASKTAAVALDDEGHILAQTSTRGSAIIGRPSPEASATLSGVIRQVLRECGAELDAVRHCAIGLNGIDLAADFPAQFSDIVRITELPKVRVSLVNDGLVALWGGTASPAAALIQYGSGITAAWRTHHGGETTFDHMDVGKFFDMRTELIARVARMIDGRMQSTALKDALLKFFGLTEASFWDAVYGGTIDRKLRIGTAALVFEAWKNGDSVATELVNGTIEDLACSLKAMAQHVDNPRLRIVFGGGVINGAPREFVATLQERILSSCPEAKVGKPELPPELGAGVMAAFNSGMNPVEFFQAVKLNRTRSATAVAL